MDNIEELNLQVKDPRKTYFVILIVILAAGAAFGLGRLSKIEEGRVPVKFSQWQATTTQQQVLGVLQTAGQPASADPPAGRAETSAGKYVGSKNSDIYHFPWCPGALRIKEENKVWFETKEAAKTAGYRPAGNCKGL